MAGYGLAVNENAATQPHEVDQRIFDDRVHVTVIYRLEVGAARAVDARFDGITWTLSAPNQSGETQLKAFRVTVPSGAFVDLTVDIVGRQDLTAEGPEAQRTLQAGYSMFVGCCGSRLATGATLQPRDRPDGTVLARYDQLGCK